ncbi:MAG: metal-sensitive transcriptional regulator [bacterium]
MLNDKERSDARRRLKTIEGQVRGLQALLEEKCLCVDFLTQLAAVHEGLRKVGKMVTRQFLETCCDRANCCKTSTARSKAYGEALDLVYKYSR